MRFATALLVGAALAWPTPTVAQGTGTTGANAAADTARVDRIRVEMRRDRSALVARNLSLTPAEAKAFAPAYERCSADLEAARRRVNRVVVDFVGVDGNVNDAQARVLADALLQAERDEAEARRACFARVLKVLPGRKAARYLQIETKLRAIDRFDVAVAIPLVD